MNIAILGLTATTHGSLTYLKNFLPGLAQCDHSNQYELLLPASHAGDLAVRQPHDLQALGEQRLRGRPI